LVINIQSILDARSEKHQVTDFKFSPCFFNSIIYKTPTQAPHNDGVDRRDF